MEQELVARVEELMSSLDSAREYKEIARSVIDSSIIITIVILAILSSILLFNLYSNCSATLTLSSYFPL
jgi:hypothetical protein